MCHFFLGPDPFPLEYVYYLIASGTMLILGCLIGGAWFIWCYKGTRQPSTDVSKSPEVDGKYQFYLFLKTIFLDISCFQWLNRASLRKCR